MSVTKNCWTLKRTMKKIQFNENKNIISDNLRKYREAAKLSQSQLAAKMQTAGINIAHRMISRVEKNLRQVTDYELAVFCEVLNVELRERLSMFYENKWPCENIPGQ